MVRLIAFVAALAGLAVPLAAVGQGALIFAVNEGVTYRTTPHETRERYRPIGEILGRSLKRFVRIEAVESYELLRRGLEHRRFDLAYVHPAHHSLRAVRDQGYRLVAVTQGFTDYRAHFLVKTGTQITRPEDLRDQSIVMPDADSITAWMVRATLRDLGIDPARAPLKTTRYQDGIPFMLEQGFFPVGATASIGVVKEWRARGGKVIFGSRPVPIKHVIVSPVLAAEDADIVRQVFLGLADADGGRALLKRLGLEGFEAPDLRVLEELGRWLGI